MLRLVLITGAAMLLLAAPAMAHPMPTSSVLLDISGREVTGVLELPLDRVAVARGHGISAAQAAGPERAALEAYVAEHMSAKGAGVAARGMLAESHVRQPSGARGRSGESNRSVGRLGRQ